MKRQAVKNKKKAKYWIARCEKLRALERELWSSLLSLPEVRVAISDVIGQKLHLWLNDDGTLNFLHHDTGRKLLQLAVAASKNSSLEKKLVASLAIREEIISGNLGLVHAVAQQYRKMHAEDYFDVLHEGILGLAEGVDKFKPEMGYTLPTYVVWWIKHAVLRYMQCNRNLVHVPVNKGLEIRVDTLSLSHPIRTEEGSVPLESCLDHEAVKSYMEVNGVDLKLVLEHATHEEAWLLCKRFGIGCERQTLQEIGEELGVTRERVRHYERGAIGRIRVRMGYPADCPEKHLKTKIKVGRIKEPWKLAS
jgi:RNA polymerase nonessential primary-like sigma factor